MTEQRHIIKRQVIDLKIDGRLNATEIQDRVSQLFKEKLAPMLSEYLDNISSPHSIDRIGNWEIDLGSIKAGDMELTLEQKLDEQLNIGKPVMVGKPANLSPEADAQHSPVPPPAHQADTDLITYFLQTGILPWWVKESKLTVFETAMNNLLQQETNIVAAFLNNLLSDQASLKRLIYTVDDDLLTSLVMKVVPNARYQPVAGMVKQLKIVNGQSLSETQFRSLWWEAVVANALSLPTLAAEKKGMLIKLYFDGLRSREIDLFSKSALTPAYHEVAAFYRDEADILQTLMNYLDLAETGSFYQSNQYLTQMSEELVKMTKAGHSTLASHISSANITYVQNLVNKIRGTFRLEQVRYNTTKNADNEHNMKHNSSDHKNDNSVDKAGKSVQRSGDRQVSDALGNETISGKDEVKGQVIFSKQTPGSNRQDTSDNIARNSYNGEPSAVNKTTPQDLFSDTDKLYIPNAGLVLLWPYLERLFASIGLLDDKAFKNRQAAEKACLLLQYITEGERWQRFGPLLPLNKLLCGIGLFEPVDVHTEITADEFAAAEHLLQAVTGNAPLWKNLSADGLRASYLQREGILSSRDGNWLLQVKRETYDILLDRLPWSFNIVKLPWMNNLIFVEW